MRQINDIGYLLILDFFAGSGTLGQAVDDLNKEDDGDRKFILVSNNESDICKKVTNERLKKSKIIYSFFGLKSLSEWENTNEFIIYRL